MVNFGIRIASAVCLALTLCSTPSLAKEIRQIVGSVGPKNHLIFLRAISKNLDKIIGLKVAVTDSLNNDVYYASGEEGRIVISTSGDTYPGYEAVINDGRYERGSWLADGFYLVKSGGMHQGIQSYGLSSVDEAQIRLMPNVTIKSINLRN